ncbi:SapC family protein [Aureimonas fodinaquatilis]|uniref:SapC family protein n=1 Tax=Aureimonas fodinaquatilis TaxID=2565783 RepID=A0A5B0DQ89_9HYPH|nr:SapC family protein [Aureimonas fodinaquatilis]KAA0968593.1 SapC family protein [Aureimonas fodinaquatilis]
MNSPISSPLSVQGELPLFYTDARVLRFADHAGLGIRRSNNLRFAAAATTVPVMLSEFAAAIRFYPLVFIGREQPVPMLALGFDGGRNLFVDGVGSWRKDHYVPAYVRRYPFLASKDVSGNHQLQADFSSGRIVSLTGSTGVEPLFEADGAAAPYARTIMLLCQAIEKGGQQAAEFSSALLEAGLLSERKVEFESDIGEAVRFAGFYSVDERAFRALPAAKLADFSARGWLELIVMHIVSQQNWRPMMQAVTRSRVQPVAAKM